MSKKEKEILKALVHDQRGSLSPVDFIKGIARGDTRLVQNLIAKGYVDIEYKDHIDGMNKTTYKIPFYTASEKGIMLFEKWNKRFWFNFKNSAAAYVGISSIILGIISITITSFVSWRTVENSLKSNEINKQIAEIEYENTQPFLIISGGDEKATTVHIQNAGGGPAKNIFFIKHYIYPRGTSTFVLSKESNILLAIASGKEGSVNLNEQSMDVLEKKEKIREIIPCFPQFLLTDDKKNWVAIFYENLRGEKFISKFNGFGGSYNQIVDFIKLDCKNE